MKKVFAAAALVAVLALAGCSSSSVQLDREVEVGGMTLNVPSDWVEDGDDTDYDFSDHVFGHRSYSYDTDNESERSYISVFYSNVDLDETPDESIASIYGDGMDYEVVDEPVIDGVKTQVVKYLFDGNSGTSMYEAFVYGFDMHYEITVVGDKVSIDDVLETVDLD